MGGSVFGNFGEEGAPGFVDTFTQGLLGASQQNSANLMTNRYNQLGMGGSTPEAQDLGHMPSVTGGIPKQYGALTGQLQTSSAANQAGGAGAASLASQIGTGLNAFSK